MTTKPMIASTIGGNTKRKQDWVKKMFKLLTILVIFSSMGCKPVTPKEVPVVPPVKVLSYTVLDGMERIQTILNDKSMSKNKKMCRLAADSLVGNALEDFWMHNDLDPVRSDIDYEIYEIAKFYDNCKKTQK